MSPIWLLAIVLAAAPGVDVDTLRIRSGSNDLTWLADSDSTARVTVADGRGQTVYSARLEGVYAKHYHPAEYHNGHLYAIRRIGNWHWPSRATLELWRYEGKKPVARLFSSGDLDFRVTPNDSVIVVSCCSDSEGTGRLVFMSPTGSVVKTLRAADLHMDYFADVWVTNRFVFFSGGDLEAGFDRVIRIQLNDWGSTDWDLSGLGFDADYDFDPELQMVVGSDYPAFVDAETADEWRKTRPVVKLHLYSLTTRSDTTIATSVAEEFRPRWLGNGIFEYTDPISGKRITRDVGQRSGRPR